MIKLTIATLTLLLASVYGADQVPTPKFPPGQAAFQAKVLKNQPVTIVLAETIGCRSSADHSPSAKITFARRGDGATITGYEALIGSRTADFDVKYPNGISVKASVGRSRVKHKKTIFFPMPALALDPAAGCAKFINGVPEQGTFSPGETVSGYKTVIWTEPGSNQFRVWKSWFAPELGCAKIKQEVTTKKTGPDGKTTEFKNITEPILISTAEPDPELFELKDYPEMTPLSFFNDACKALSLRGKDPKGEVLEKLKLEMTEQDKRYHENRKKYGLE